MSSSKQETTSKKRTSEEREEHVKQNETKKEKKEKKSKKEEKENEEELIDAPPYSHQSTSQQPSSINSRGNVTVSSFANLFYGRDKEDIDSWTKKLNDNGYNNENKLCRKFLQASKGNIDELISLLISFSFNQIHAIIIANRILSSGLNH